MAIIKVKQKNGSYKNIEVVKGKSAYEIACSNGFVGTEKEWLESLESVKEEDVLTKTNTMEYNPTEDYHPSTKKYVDDLQPKALFEIPTDGALKTAYFDIDQITTPGIYYSNKWGVFSIRYKDADDNAVTLDSLMKLSDSNNQYMEVEVTEVNSDTIKYNYVIDQTIKYFSYDIANKTNISLTKYPIKYFENFLDSTKVIGVELNKITEPGLYLAPLNKYGVPYTTIYFKLLAEDGGVKGSLLMAGGTSTSFSITSASDGAMDIGVKEYYITYKAGATKDDCIWKKTLKTLSINNTIEYTPTEDYNPATKKYVDDLTSNNQTTDEDINNMIIEVLGNDYIEKEKIIIFEGSSSDPLVISDYYEINGAFSYVIDKQIALDNTSFPYTIEVGNTADSISGIFTPDKFSYNNGGYWIGRLDEDKEIYVSNDYDGENKLVIAYDLYRGTGSIGFNYMKIYTT